VGQAVPVHRQKLGAELGPPAPFFRFPPAIRKVIFLAIQKASAKWTQAIQEWASALNHFAIMFEGRI
jgi:transposase-like protein